MPKPAQVATRTPANAKDRSAADAVEPNRRRFKPSTAFCRQRWCAGRSRDCEAVQRLSTQVVGNTRRKISPMTTRHVACKVIVDACQEYEELACLASGESMAKIANIRACSSTVFCKGASLLKIEVTVLLKSSASRQEKASHCNGNGAASNKHFRHCVACDLCRDVNTTRPEHLNSLLDHDLLTARSQTMPHKPRNGAAGGRAGRWILAVVELHARVPVGS